MTSTEATEETVGERLDKANAEAIAKVREDWARVMTKPDSPERSEAIGMILDRANMLGIGRMDRP